MAFQTGTQVNAALGRTDFTPFLQGAMQGAQAQARGAENIAQGLAGLGQQVAGGLERQYKEGKELKKEERGYKDTIASSKKIMEALKVAPNIPDSVKEFLPRLSQTIDNPNVSLSEQAASATMLGNLFGSVLSSGLSQTMQDQSRIDRGTRLGEVLQKYTKPAPPLMIAKPGAEAKPINQTELTSDLLKAGATPEEIATLSKTLPFAQKQQLDTALHRNVVSTIDAEIKSGILKPQDYEKRYAKLMANAGRDIQDRFPAAGTYVRRSDQQGAIQAVRNTNTGQIGTVDQNGKFEPLDSASMMPMTTSDANVFLDQAGFKKLGDEVVNQEIGIKQINRFIEGAGNLPQGVDKLTKSASAAIKTIFTKEPLTEEEKELGFSKARQQGLLGALRTTILGPGVLTEIDAQRILDRLGGDITSVATNPALLKEIVSEVLMDKMAQYEDNLNIYNSHVAGRYGSWGVKQRVRVVPFTESNLASIPPGMDVGIWGAMTPDEKKKFAQPKK